MGNVNKKLYLAKKCYRKYPNCCNDKTEMPKNPKELNRLLWYIELCRVKDYDCFEFLREYSEFNFDNVTRWVDMLTPLDKFIKIVNTYPHFPWDVRKIYEYTDVVHPAIVVRGKEYEDDFDWSYSSITAEYWPLILKYSIRWNLPTLQVILKVGDNCTKKFLVKILDKYTGYGWKFSDDITDDFVGYYFETGKWQDWKPWKKREIVWNTEIYTQ